MKILIIDDNKEYRETMESIFSEKGYGSVIFADDGQQGIAKAKLERPDLVILDTRLPGLDGFEVCRRIRQNEGPDKPKIIITTGFIDAVDAGKARSAGADDYLVKTSDFSLFLKAIDQLFKR